jgi:peptide/nickel transport system permease protein
VPTIFNVFRKAYERSTAMIRFVFKRLLTMIPVLLFVTLIIFTMSYFTPGDPAEFTLGDLATEEDREVFREEHGLNDPYIVQYYNYVSGILLEGDLGTSYATKRPVMKEILNVSPIR